MKMFAIGKVVYVYFLAQLVIVFCLNKVIVDHIFPSVLGGMF